MNHRIAVGVVVLVLAAGSASAQGRETQVVTGASLTTLGVYAAVMDRDCDIHAQTTLMNGQCEWRTAAGHLTGSTPELSQEQLATGPTVAGIGSLMMAGAWEPSKGVDTLFTAGAGFILLATAWDDNYPAAPHERTSDGRTLTNLPHARGFSRLRLRCSRTRRLLPPRLVQPHPHDVVGRRSARVGRRPGAMA